MLEFDSKVIVLVALLPFLFYFFTPSLVGFDSFASLGFVCGLDSYSAPFVWGSFLGLLPCNVLFVKFVQFLSYLFVLFLIKLFGQFVFGERGWLLGVFAGGLCPLLFQTSLQFEATWFGFVVAWFGFVGFVWFNNPQTTNKSNIKWLFLTLLMLSCLIWSANFLLLIALSLYYIPLLLATIPIALFNLQKLITYAFNGNILSKQPIAEEMFLVGAAPTLFLWPFLDSTPKKWLLPTLFLFFIGLIKVKFMFLSVPFLCLGLFVLYDKIKNQKILGKYKTPNLIFFCICASISFGLLATTMQPTQKDLDLIDYSIKASQELKTPLYNDWSYGWWIEYKGQPTEYKSSYPNPDYNSLKKPFLALTIYDTNQECITLKENKPLKLLYCN